MIASTDSTVEVRICSAADLALLVESWPLAGRVHEAHFELQVSGSGTYLVAWRADHAVGTAVVRWTPTLEPQYLDTGSRCAELCHVQVRREAQGQGVGTNIVTAAKRLAQSRGYTHMVLGVTEDNHVARNVYRALGFEGTGQWIRNEYDWVDEYEQSHHEVEINEIFVSSLQGN